MRLGCCCPGARLISHTPRPGAFLKKLVLGDRFGGGSSCEIGRSLDALHFLKRAKPCFTHIGQSSKSDLYNFLLLGLIGAGNRQKALARLGDLCRCEIIDLEACGLNSLVLHILGNEIQNSDNGLVVALKELGDFSAGPLKVFDAAGLVTVATLALDGIDRNSGKPRLLRPAPPRAVLRRSRSFDNLLNIEN